MNSWRPALRVVRVEPVAFVALVALMLTTAAGSAAAVQPRVFALPPAGGEPEQKLAPGDADEWRVDLAAGEFLVVAIEPLARGDTDEWPAVTVVAADDASVFESAEPFVTSGIDGVARTVVSFIAARTGPYRLR